MPLKDDNHETARIIKDLERRIADLEEQLRSDSTPNILTSVSDETAVDDNVSSVRERTIGDLEWNADHTGSTGWNTDAWGQYA